MIILSRYHQAADYM